MINYYMETREYKRKKYIKEHRIKSLKSRKTWTTKDIEFLKKHYSTMDKVSLEKHLNVSYRKIYLIASKLGLKREV